jgi:hypothetical protein
MDNDMRLAAHVTHVHMHSAAPELQFTPIPELVLRYAVGVPWVPASLGVPSQEGAGGRAVALLPRCVASTRSSRTRAIRTHARGAGRTHAFGGLTVAADATV